MKILGCLASNQKVIDRHQSHLAIEIDLLSECFKKINANGEDYIETEINFPHTVGLCNIVETRPEDKIVYLKRPGRLGKSRFVLNKVKLSSNIVTVVMKKALELHSYVLVTAYIGSKAPPEPFDKNATEYSQHYWNSHAFVLDK